MARYLMLFRFTEKGSADIKDSPNRVEGLKQTFKEAGAEIKEFYALLGRYDTMFIAEAPDDETIARLALTIGSKGNVHTETLRAFTMDEYRGMLAGIP
jgi:uncharacterized protein with GYD domain